jgi:hypothetical protein
MSSRWIGISSAIMLREGGASAGPSHPNPQRSSRDSGKRRILIGGRSRGVVVGHEPHDCSRLRERGTDRLDSGVLRQSARPARGTDAPAFSDGHSGAVLVRGYLRGDSFCAIEEFGHARKEWLQTFLRLRHGIPTHDTLGRVFAPMYGAMKEAPARFRKSRGRPRQSANLWHLTPRTRESRLAQAGPSVVSKNGVIRVFRGYASRGPGRAVVLRSGSRWPS